MAAISIKEIKVRFAKICDMVDAPQDLRDEYNAYFDKFEAHPLADILIEQLNSSMDSMVRLQELFNSVNNGLYQEFINQQKPIIILHPTDPTLLRVYDNMVLSAGNTETFKDITVLELGDTFKALLAGYDLDMSGKIPGSQAKWETKDRILKRLTSYTDMPTARVLSRYTNFDVKYNPATHTTIRDFAAAIDEARKPMELTFAEKPEDFCIMYGSGPSSCMSVHGGNSSRFKWMFDHNFCPASFYAYFPYTRGAYVLKNKKVIGRTVIYKDSKTEAWYYGSIYADTSMKQKFIQTLESNNIRPLSKHVDYQKHNVYEVPEGTTFTIPGTPYQKAGVFCMPWPYFDNMDYYGKGFYASYSKEKNEFTITYNKSKKSDTDMLPIQIQDGLLLSVDYMDRKCDYCNKVHKDKGFNWYMSADGHAFDCLECMLAAGYVRVRTAQAKSYQLPTETLIPIHGLRNSVFFSTIKAASDAGFFPLVGEDGTIPEEGDMQVTNAFQVAKEINGVTYVSKIASIFDDKKDKLSIDRNTPMRNVELEVSDDEYRMLTAKVELFENEMVAHP